MKSLVIFFSIFLITSSILNASPSVAVGPDHTLFLDPSGNMWASGNNDHGQLGIRGAAFVAIPTKVPFEGTIVTVACGPQTSYAIDDGGFVWAWGKNDFAELGLGHADWVDMPEKMKDLSNIERVAPGDIHSLAVDNKGGVWQWNVWESQHIAGPLLWNGMFLLTTIHTILRDKDGQIFIWESMPELDKLTNLAMRNKPRLLPTISHTFSIVQGNLHSLRTLGNSQIYFSDNHQPWVMSRHEIAPASSVCMPDDIFVASNFSRIFCKNPQGTIVAKGKNKNGELGLGHREHQPHFAPVHFGN